MSYYSYESWWRRHSHDPYNLEGETDSRDYNTSSSSPRGFRLPRRNNRYSGYGYPQYFNAYRNSDSGNDDFSHALRRSGSHYNHRPYIYGQALNSAPSDSRDHFENHSNRLLKPKYKKRRHRKREQTIRVIVVWILVGLLVFVGLCLGLGLGLGLDNSSDDDEKTTSVPTPAPSTSPYRLTYLIDANFDSALLDDTSQAYTDLRNNVVGALTPICNCEVSNVTFYNGSIGVTAYLEVPETMTTTELQARLLSGVDDGTLLPNNQVIAISITLTNAETEPIPTVTHTTTESTTMVPTTTETTKKKKVPTATLR